MFTELLNGLLDRRQKEASVSQTADHNPLSPDLRIGIIPAGKQNIWMLTCVYFEKKTLLFYLNSATSGSVTFLSLFIE